MIAVQALNQLIALAMESRFDADLPAIGQSMGVILLIVSAGSIPVTGVLDRLLGWFLRHASRPAIMGLPAVAAIPAFNLNACIFAPRLRVCCGRCVYVFDRDRQCVGANRAEGSDTGSSARTKFCNLELPRFDLFCPGSVDCRPALGFCCPAQSTAGDYNNHRSGTGFIGLFRGKVRAPLRRISFSFRHRNAVLEHSHIGESLDRLNNQIDWIT